MNTLARRRRTLPILAAALIPIALLAAGAKQEAKPAAEPLPPLELPASANPAPELAELAFLAGRWVGVNPNGTVNEEHWSAPRGNHMVALFRQVRRDGKPALIEVSLITAEAEGIFLRLRHLHTNLEVPASRADVSLFTLKSAENNRVEFAGTGAAEQVTGVVYRLTGPHEMTVDVSFAPDSKEKGFSMKYRREGH
jgi:hypothetical protein